MRSILLGVGFIYFLLVANFYNESHGFTKYYNSMYPIWKVTPIVFLFLFSLLHGDGMPKYDRILSAAALFFGGVGDYLIGSSHDGIVTGAIAFGIGHIIYLSLFATRRTLNIHWPVLVGVLLWGAIVGHVCLMPMLAEHTIPVIIMVSYSLILSSCTIIAISHYLNPDPSDSQQGVKERLLGFLLFYCSDSILIMHDTGRSLPSAELLILGTYFSAQFLILAGNISSITSKKVKSH